VDEPSPQVRALAQAVAEYLTHRQAAKPSPHTLAAYRSDLAAVQALLAQHVKAPADRLSTADLTVANMRAVFAAYAGDHAKASIARAISTTSGLCDFLVEEDTLAGNPMAGVARPKVTRAAPKALSAEAVDQLIDVLQTGQIPARRPWPQRDYAVIATLAVTGLRAAELRELNIGDLEGSPTERHLAVRHGKGDKTHRR
jgi:site-specific recombinase XerC